jgi:hypothetical protein
VFRVQEWAEVYRLFIERDAQGRDRRATRHELHTGYRLLAHTESPRYERELRPSLLDPHKAKIAELLALDGEAPATVVVIDHLANEGKRDRPMPLSPPP